MQLGMVITLEIFYILQLIESKNIGENYDDPLKKQINL